jgi:hypothetical protein
MKYIRIPFSVDISTGHWKKLATFTECSTFSLASANRLDKHSSSFSQILTLALQNCVLSVITGSFNDWKLSPFTSLSFGPSLKYYSLWVQVDKAKLYTFKHAICMRLQKCSCMVDIRFLCVQVWCQRLGKKFNKLAMFSHFRGKFKFYVQAFL